MSSSWPIIFLYHIFEIKPNIAYQGLDGCLIKMTTIEHSKGGPKGGHNHWLKVATE